MEWIVMLPWDVIVPAIISYLVGVVWKQPKVAKQILERCKMQKPG